MIRQPPTLGEALARIEAEASCRLDGETQYVSTGLEVLLPYPLVVTIWGLTTKSEANQREHHMAKYRRTKGQRKAVAVALVPYRNILLQIGTEVMNHGATLHVQFTRIAPRRLDTDNCVGAFKHVRDELADHLGVDDGHDGVKWLPPEQQTGRDAVVIRVWR